MSSMKVIIARAILAVVTGTFLVGCASGFTTVAPTPPQQYSLVGKVTGTACGSMGVLATAFYFIPMGANNRVENAYNNAVASVPGATALLDVTIKEDWYWWLIGTARCVTVSGEAIK